MMMIRSDQQQSHQIITINGKMNFWECKLIFPTDKLQQTIESMYFLLVKIRRLLHSSVDSRNINFVLILHHSYYVLPQRKVFEDLCFCVVQRAEFFNFKMFKSTSPYVLLQGSFSE